MTGHLLYGNYYFKDGSWQSDQKNLSDSFNKFIHLIFTLSDGKHLAFWTCENSPKSSFSKRTRLEIWPT